MIENCIECGKKLSHPSKKKKYCSYKCANKKYNYGNEIGRKYRQGRIK